MVTVTVTVMLMGTVTVTVTVMVTVTVTVVAIVMHLYSAILSARFPRTPGGYARHFRIGVCRESY